MADGLLSPIFVTMASMKKDSRQLASWLHLLLALLISAPAKGAPCEVVQDDLAEQSASDVLAKLLPQSRKFDLLNEARHYRPKSRIEDGTNVADYLRRSLPTRFKTEFSGI